MTNNRVAIITGATRGIGFGVAKRLIASGVHVATCYHRDEAAAAQFRSCVEDAKTKCILHRLDIRDLDKLREFVSSVLNEFGRVDYLINNVAIDFLNTTVHDMPWEEWKTSQDIILNTPLFLCKQALPTMRRQRFGRIINIGASSKDYMKGAPGLAAFGVHKAALAILTKTLALEEIAHGITVNMVAPGSTADAGMLPEEERIPINRIPLGRRAEIDEVVEAIMYFLSDKASGVTGQFIGVNGGLST